MEHAGAKKRATAIINKRLLALLFYVGGGVEKVFILDESEE